MALALSRQPLYCQVADVIAQRIADGTWKPGSPIPNEVDLAREMGVSPGTVRKALDRLEADRMLIRRQGRGTFVEDHSNDKSAARFDLLRDKTGTAIDRGGELLSQGRYAANELEKERLELAAGQHVLRTTRVRSCHKRPVMHETAALALPRFAGITDTDPGDYVLTALAQEQGILLARATERVTLCAATAEVAQSLEVMAGTTLLHLDRVIFSLRGEPIEWRVGVCNLQNQYYAVAMN